MIAVLSAMQAEIDLLLEKMTDKEPTTLCGNTYTVGTLQGKQAVVGTSSIGKTNAAIGAQALIDRFYPDCLLHTGIAGSLCDQAGLLCVVLGEQLTYHDLDHQIMLDFPPHTEYFKSDPKLLKLAEEHLRREGDRYLKGLIATGDAFIESSAQKKAITDRMPALAADMESASIACCCHVNGVPFLVVRAISDLADENSHDTYKEHKRGASDVGASLIMDLIQKI